MLQICSFDPNVDIQETVPDLCVDLSDAIESHVVLDTGVEPFYNDIEDPSAITGIVKDAFEAIDLQRKLGKEYAKSVAAKAAADAAAGKSEPDKGAQG